jgi:hypothetical protein
MQAAWQISDEYAAFGASQEQNAQSLFWADGLF